MWDEAQKREQAVLRGKTYGATLSFFLLGIGSDILAAVPV